MRNQQVLKLFLVLILCITYIFSFSHFGAQAYDSVINRNDLFAEGTMIGSLSVAGKTTNEALQLTDEQLTKWLNETSITLKYREKSELLDLSYLSFDIEKTVSQVKHGQENSVVVALEPIDELLQTLSPSLTSDSINMDELQSEILQSAKLLETGNYEIRIDQFLVNASDSDFAIIAESVIEAEYVENDLEQFVGQTIEIGPLSQFSFLAYVEEIGTVSSLSLSKLASAVYEVVLPTNFSIIERHISNELPAYTSLGFEAKADKDLKNDLVFSNPNEFSYFLEFEKKNDSIHVYLKGPEFLNGYVILPEGKETFEPKIIRQFNPQLGPTEIKVKVEGKEGQLIKVYREHQDEKGEVLKKELISEDFYPPIHQVEVQGLIINEGDLVVPPTFEDSEMVDDPTNMDPSTDNPFSNIPEGSDSDLWGKENEIPK